MSDWGQDYTRAMQEPGITGERVNAVLVGRETRVAIERHDAEQARRRWECENDTIIDMSGWVRVK